MTNTQEHSNITEAIYWPSGDWIAQAKCTCGWLSSVAYRQGDEAAVKIAAAAALLDHRQGLDEDSGAHEPDRASKGSAVMALPPTPADAEAQSCTLVNLHRHDSRPGSWCALVAPDARPGARWHISYDPHGDFNQRTVYNSRSDYYLFSTEDTSAALSLVTEWYSPGGRARLIAAAEAKTLALLSDLAAKRAARPVQARSADFEESPF